MNKSTFLTVVNIRFILAVLLLMSTAFQFFVLRPHQELSVDSSVMTALATSFRYSSLSSAPKQPKLSIPVVVISSMRGPYLSKVLESLDHQHPRTPDWILDSNRYLFVHRHEKNDIGDRFNQTKALATQHDLSLHVFDGLLSGNPPHKKPTMAYYAKYTWYQMMDFLFHSLNVSEALILEDDAELSFDGMLTAAALFREKWNRTDVHSIAMGGWSGVNRINAAPNTFLAVRSQYFQAMAYSMNRTLFEHIHSAFLEYAPANKHEPIVNDWTEEITVRGFVKNLTILTPSVGRMHHVGAMGMGVFGDGKKERVIYPPAWESWQIEIHNRSRDVSDFYLDPLEVTDLFGFICDPMPEDAKCGYEMKYFLLDSQFSPSQVDRYGRYANLTTTKQKAPTKKKGHSSNKRAANTHKATGNKKQGSGKVEANAKQKQVRPHDNEKKRSPTRLNEEHKGA